VRYSVLLYMTVEFVFFNDSYFFSASHYMHSASRTALTTLWARSHRPPTQYKFTQHNTRHSVQWQFGSDIEDNAYMRAFAREFSYVFGMADTSS